jgi:hypothetical protein
MTGRLLAAKQWYKSLGASIHRGPPSCRAREAQVAGGEQGGLHGEMAKPSDDCSIEKLRAELLRLKDRLRDVEDMHAFTFGKTSAHIGGKAANAMTAEYEAECLQFNQRIAAIESALKTKATPQD